MKWKNSEIKGAEPAKKAALTALNRKNWDVTGGEPKKAALMALNWRNSGSNGVEPEK